jgi:hypothetical protein
MKRQIVTATLLISLNAASALAQVGFPITSYKLTDLKLGQRWSGRGGRGRLWDRQYRARGRRVHP